MHPDTTLDRAPRRARRGLLMGWLALALYVGTALWIPASVNAQAPAKDDKKAAPGKQVTTAATAVKPSPVRKQGGAKPLTQIDEHVSYQYNALGRRDPFQSLVQGVFVGADVGGDAPVDIGGIKVVGIVWGTTDKFALVEDPRGNSLVLRRGDKVMNGVVKRLMRNAIVVEHNVDETSQMVTIPLTKKGDKNVSH